MAPRELRVFVGTFNFGNSPVRARARMRKRKRMPTRAARAAQRSAAPLPRTHHAPCRRAHALAPLPAWVRVRASWRVLCLLWCSASVAPAAAAMLALEQPDLAFAEHFVAHAVGYDLVLIGCAPLCTLPKRPHTL
jgi:hypothetical protein